jgi:hypothetical protein
MEEESPGGDTGGGWFASPRRRTLIIAALLSFMFIMVLTASLGDAPTIDEPIYITSGYLYLRDGNFTLNMEHPPLIKEILALPLAFKEFNYSEPPIATFYTGQNQYAHDFLFNMGNPADTMLQVSRFPAYFMLMALGLLIYAWSKRIFGYRAGLISLFFFVFTPLFLGNGQLAILDLGATLFMTAALYSFYVLLEKFSTRRFLACAILTAAALLSRFDMVILMLLLPLLAVSRPFFVLRKGENQRRGKECLAWLGRSLGILLTAFLIVLVFYGMHTSSLTREQQESNIRVNLTEGSPYVGPLLAVNEVSPPLAHYLLGVAHDYEFVQLNPRSYWNGSFSEQWRWYYYPFVFLLKTPLAMVFLFLLGLAVGLRRFRQWRSTYVLISLAIMALYIESSRIQLGGRHIMSIYPLVLLMVGIGGAELVRAGKGKGYRALLLGALMAFAAVSVVSFYPSFLSYSNELVIHKDQASRWLIDSDLDIGQDLKRLAEYVKENNITGLTIDYVGGGEPLYYLPPDTVEWTRPLTEFPHGWFALSITRRQDSYWETQGNVPPPPSDYSNWIGEHQPVAIIGNSILLYYLP